MPLNVFDTILIIVSFVVLGLLTYYVYTENNTVVTSSSTPVPTPVDSTIPPVSENPVQASPLSGNPVQSKDVTTCNVPDVISSNYNTSATNSTITISNLTSNGATSFKFNYGASAKQSNNLTTTMDANNNNSYTLSSLNSNSNYVISITAINSCGTQPQTLTIRQSTSG